MFSTLSIYPLWVVKQHQAIGRKNLHEKRPCLREAILRRENCTGCKLSRNYVNVIVAGKQPELQWLNMDDAIKHCTAGLGIWEWASNDKGGETNVVMARCGDVPTLETLAAVQILRQHLPGLVTSKRDCYVR